MAKKKEAQRVTPDSLLSSIISDREKKHGHAYRVDEHRDHTFGISLKYMPLMWCLGGSDKFPLGRIIGISGEYGSFKSSLMAELGKLFITQNGVFCAVDAEQKTSGTAYEAMYDQLEEYDRRNAGIEIAKTTEDWQEICMDLLSRFKDKSVTSLEPGQRIPSFVAVDSIVGRETAAEQEKLEEEGHAAARGYATINNMIKKFFGGISLLGTTTALGYVTHMKDEQGGDEGKGRMSFGKPKKELGGTSPGFFATFILRNTRGKAISYVDEDGCEVEGFVVKIKAHKTSLGPNNRSIDVPFVWRMVMDDSEDGFRQESWFDWHWATTWLICKFIHDDKFSSGSRREELRNILSYVKSKCGSVTTPKFCTNFNNGEVPGLEADREYTAREFGRIVHETPELFNILRKFLRVHLYPDVQETDKIDYRA